MGTRTSWVGLSVWPFMVMIEINLYPQESRKKRRQLLSGGLKLPMEVIIGLAGGFMAILVVVHLGLLFINITQLRKHKELKKQWEVLLPAKENVDKVIFELRSLQEKQKSLEKMTVQGRINWARKLNIISSILPRGVWLTKIILKDDVFFIEGSAISKTSNEIINVHSFTANLKNEDAFLEYFTDLELGSIQRRKVNNIEVADFLITAQLKKE